MGGPKGSAPIRAPLAEKGTHCVSTLTAKPNCGYYSVDEICQPIPNISPNELNMSADLNRTWHETLVARNDVTMTQPGPHVPPSLRPENYQIDGKPLWNWLRKAFYSAPMGPSIVKQGSSVAHKHAKAQFHQ